MATKTLDFRYKLARFSFEIDEREEIISSTIQSTGVWEPYQLDVYEKFLPKEGVFVDVGANVGINSIYARHLRPSLRIVAIEASEGNFAILERNTDGLEIDCRFLAISDVDGMISFGGSGTNARISTDEAATEQVKSRRLDTFADEAGIAKIDLLKIDVEGFADLVLSGAAHTLSISQHIIVEFSVHDIVERFKCDNARVEAEFENILNIIKVKHPYYYYISRKDGLVRFADATDLIEILSTEYGVGDVIFSTTPLPNAISIFGFAIRKIKELMAENHSRIMEIGSLNDRVS